MWKFLINCCGDKNTLSYFLRTPPPSPIDQAFLFVRCSFVWPKKCSWHVTSAWNRKITSSLFVFASKLNFSSFFRDTREFFERHPRTFPLILIITTIFGHKHVHLSVNQLRRFSSSLGVNCWHTFAFLQSELRSHNYHSNDVSCSLKLTSFSEFPPLRDTFLIEKKLNYLIKSQLMKSLLVNRNWTAIGFVSLAMTRCWFRYSRTGGERQIFFLFFLRIQSAPINEFAKVHPLWMTFLTTVGKFPACIPP